MTNNEVNQTLDRWTQDAKPVTWRERVRALLTILLAAAILTAIYYGVPAIYDLVQFHIWPWLVGAAAYLVLWVSAL